jgi:hypothetical protein
MEIENDGIMSDTSEATIPRFHVDRKAYLHEKIRHNRRQIYNYKFYKRVSYS